MTVSQQTIAIEGRSAKFWLGGTGKPLVLLHGGLGDARQHWQPTFEALADRFQILAPDLPGFGVSDPLPMPGYQSYLSWITYLLELLNIGGPIALMGNSFGATLARLYTAENTSYVARLVLVDGGNIVDANGCLRALFRVPGVNNLIFGLGRRIGYSTRSLKLAIKDEALLTPDFIANARAASHGFVAAMKQIGLSSTPSLRTPTCPTLVVWGEADRLSLPVAGKQIAAEIPGAKFNLIPNAAHLPQIEQPAAFHALVGPFLSGK
ncbi:MAG: alpha/beta hydrolase [Thermoflexales bacterium]|nr:alpha/beta hydrolase [Thermoflexales bacterium]